MVSPQVEPMLLHQTILPLGVVAIQHLRNPVRWISNHLYNLLDTRQI